MAAELPRSSSFVHTPALPKRPQPEEEGAARSGRAAEAEAEEEEEAPSSLTIGVELELSVGATEAWTGGVDHSVTAALAAHSRGRIVCGS